MTSLLLFSAAQPHIDHFMRYTEGWLS